MIGEISPNPLGNIEYLHENECAQATQPVRILYREIPIKPVDID